MILLIRNIDRSLTKQALASMLLKYCRIDSFDLVMDEKTGQSKGFGFANIPKDKDAEQVIRELNGKKLGSSVLRVKRAANSSIRKHREQ